MTISTNRTSQEIFQNSCKVIPGGVNSPVRAFIGLEMDPLIVDKGFKDLIWDVDGKVYIDYCMSWGALLHGHAPFTVIEKVISRLKKGSSFGITTSLEEEISRLIVGVIPGIEKLRFVSSGTEATMTAIRLARGYTGKSFIIKFNGHYHGHADLFLVQAGSGVAQLDCESSSSGVLKESIQHTLSLPFNDLEKASKLFSHSDYAHKIAAVILEPIAANMGVVPGTKEFLKFLRKETKRIGALLIFDEVISGFRVGLNGAQGIYGIEPDLTCLGKIIGGGFPAAAFGGKQDIMHCLAPIGKVYQAGTLSGNPIAIQAGLETVQLAMQEGFYAELKAKTRLITEPVQDLLKKRNLNACLQETVGMFTLFWGVNEVKSFEDLQKIDHKMFKIFFKYLYDRGVYFPPSPYEACFISAAHTKEHLIKTRDLLIEFITHI